ncbi:hypothetical protein F3J27_22625 [Enterobacter sp. Ap-916]|uniref:helix-turn-helix transcriptional regulator n=1 Tax=Enterobacteriaceae TaxID=543 RepID=UPI00027299F3|nr:MULTISPECIES: VI polysaccharide biosynthesis protein [unclassified Enterobacter]EJF28938.1 VI polysaccharide biosynthesis protein [Enterobacter sp. Ag1]NIF61103.1 hypothetical protein [Enterobacter sp. Ap-867]NIG32254.1 hypothetical protein [Enterobacter sp. Ap-916]
MDKCGYWPENDSFFGKGIMAIAEIAGRKNLYFVNLDESTFYDFITQPQILNIKSIVIISSPTLYPLSLLLLTEFANVHAVLSSDSGLERLANSIRRIPDNGKITAANYSAGALTLPEYRTLTLLAQDVSMKHIACILGTSISTAYVYRKKLSEKMRFPHNGIPVYMKR